MILPQPEDFSTQNDYNIEDFPLTPDGCSLHLADMVHDSEKEKVNQQKIVLIIARYGKFTQR